MNENTHHTRGRGSNPASRANIAKAQASRNCYVFTRDTFPGEWQPIAGPFHYREAARKAQALNTKEQPDFASVSSLTDAEAYQCGVLKGERAKRYLDSLATTQTRYLRYLVHATERAAECFETEAVPLFFIYERGKFDTVNHCGAWLATCDNGTNARLIAEALNQFQP